MLEYLSTPIYNKNNPKMITFNDMKKYKYLIDPDIVIQQKFTHIYFAKRVIFRVKK